MSLFGNKLFRNKLFRNKLFMKRMWFVEMVPPKQLIATTSPPQRCRCWKNWYIVRI